MPAIDPLRATLRQMAATLAYRAAKVLRDVPPDSAIISSATSTRQPVQILAHMGDLMTWGVSIAGGGIRMEAGGGDDWQTEVDRFFNGLAALDAALAGRRRVQRLDRQADSGPARRCADARRPARDVRGMMG